MENGTKNISWEQEITEEKNNVMLLMADVTGRESKWKLHYFTIPKTQYNLITIRPPKTLVLIRIVLFGFSDPWNLLMDHVWKCISVCVPGKHSYIPAPFNNFVFLSCKNQPWLWKIENCIFCLRIIHVCRDAENKQLLFLLLLL